MNLPEIANIALHYPAHKGRKWIVWEADGTYYVALYLYGGGNVEIDPEGFVTTNLADAKAYIAAH